MDMEVMVIMATTARERLSQLLLPKLMLNQDITIMAMVVMAMEVMVIMATTARERLSQLLLLKLKLMLSQDIIIMVTLMAMAMDTATMDTMARGTQRLPLDTIIMDILMAMVAMDTTVTMERGRLML